MKHALSRRGFAFGALGSALALPALAQTRQRLRVAVEGQNPPWNYVTPDGTIAGADVDISNELCRRLDVECQISAQAWDGIIPGLLANRFDVIVAGMAMTPARRERVAFTDVYRNVISVFIVRGAEITDISPAGLRGRRIGVQRGASQHLFLQRSGYEQTATIVPYETVGGPELDLLAGRVDAIIMNKVTAHLGLLRRPEARDLRIVGEDLVGGLLGDGAGIALRRGDTDLLARLNAAIAAMRADGTLRAIYARYVPFEMI